MAKLPQPLILTLCTLMFGSSCSSEQLCTSPYANYNVYLYQTPEQTYLFFKNDLRPMGYTVTGDEDFWSEIQQEFSSHIGRAIGVEASICGKIEPINLPLSSYSRNMTIKAGSVLKPVDVTELIENYKRQLGTPTPGARQSESPLSTTSSHARQ